MQSIDAFPHEGNWPIELPLSAYAPEDRPHVAFVREMISDARERRAFTDLIVLFASHEDRFRTIVVTLHVSPEQMGAVLFRHIWHCKQADGLYRLVAERGEDETGTPCYRVRFIPFFDFLAQQIAQPELDDYFSRTLHEAKQTRQMRRRKERQQRKRCAS